LGDVQALFAVPARSLIAAFCLLTALLVMTGCDRGKYERLQPILSDDRFCEVWLSQQLHQLTDMWRQRYGLVVWCQGSAESAQAMNREWTGQGEIVVTVTLANGEESPSTDQAASAEMLLRTQLEKAVATARLADQYPKRQLRFVP
jgi:hypothetical protein